MRMRLQKIMAFIVMAAACLSIQYVIAEEAFAEGAVWKIEKSGQHIFIGGTMHILSPSDYPLPVSFEVAYSQSDKLMFETDISALSDPQTQITMVQKLVYQDGSTIQDYISESTWQRLQQFCADRGLPISSIATFKPGMLTIVMTLFELQRLGMVAEGVDQFYQNKAIADGKPYGQFETVDEQLSFLERMGEGDVDRFVQYNLEEINQIAAQMADIKNSWRQGNLQTLYQFGIDKLKTQFPLVFQFLLVDRNNAWMPKIITMFDSNEVEFVLVGALHLAGPEGLISQLQNRGYTVTKL